MPPTPAQALIAASTLDLTDSKRIVPERVEDLAEHDPVPGVRGHSVQLGLELIAGDGSMPPRFERVRFLQVILDPRPNHLVGHDGGEWRLRSWILLRPDSVVPIDSFDRSLCGDAIFEGERSVHRRYRGRALNAERAQGDQAADEVRHGAS
jgi:hypothetical protein